MGSLQKFAKPGEDIDKARGGQPLDLSSLEKLAEEAKKARAKAESITEKPKVKRKYGGLYCTCGKKKGDCNIGPFSYRER